MKSLSFEPTDENIELIEALLEGLNGFAKKLSATQETEDMDNDDYDGPDPCELENTASWRFGSREDYMEADMEGQI